MPSIREAGLRLFAEGGLYTVGMVLVRAGNLLLLPLYLGLLDRAEYGAYGVVRQLAGVLVPLAVVGQVHSLLRLAVDREDDPVRAGRLLESVVAWVAGASAVLTGVAVLAWPVVARWIDGVPLWPLGLAGLGLVAGQALFNIAQAWLQAIRKARAHTALSVVRIVLLLVGVLVFVVGLRWGAAGLLLAMSLSFALSAVVSLGRHLPSRLPRPRRDELRASLSYGAPLLPHALGGVLFGATGQVLLAADPSLGLALAGAYLLATQIGSIPTTLGVGIQKAWVPFYLREDRDREELGWSRVRVLSFYSLAAVALASVATGLFAPEIVALAGIFSGDDWSAAATVVPVLAIAALLRSYYSVPLAVVLADDRSARWVGAVTVPAAVLNIGLCLLWIPDHGMAGAAWALVCAWAVSALGIGALARGARAVPFKYARAAALLVLATAALLLAEGRPLPARAGLLALFTVALAALDGRDLLRAARSLRG